MFKTGLRINPQFLYGKYVILFAMVFLFVVSGCGDQIAEEQNSTHLTNSIQPGGTMVFTSNQAANFVRLALECAVQQYPNKIGHTMLSDADMGTPRSLHPSFYGCFDWHSSVHGHWLLVRFARLYPDHPLAVEAREVLNRHLVPEYINAEVEYLLAEGRSSWERPYGLVWLLQLAMELQQWSNDGEDDARGWALALKPLELACVDRLQNWLPKLAYPIRTGEHSQTAFAFGLMLDYAGTANNITLAELVGQTTIRLYGNDVAGDLSYEPSGQDFLSPILAEADLMRRVMAPVEFSTWLEGFMPDIPRGAVVGWLPTATVTDRSDGKLAHLDGLNLSRAWMLEGIISGLPTDDLRRGTLLLAAMEHKEAGLSAVTGDHYAGGHWLGTYAMYLSTRRGLGIEDVFVPES